MNFDFNIYLKFVFASLTFLLYSKLNERIFHDLHVVMYVLKILKSDPYPGKYGPIYMCKVINVVKAVQCDNYQNPCAVSKINGNLFTCSSLL